MEELKKIVLEGNDAQRKEVFAFTRTTPVDHIYAKFQLFTRYFYPKFFKSKDAPFHKDMVLYFIKLYTGQLDRDEFLDIGFRGCSKSTFAKLFMVFALACDEEHLRKYFKILSSDLQNSKQMVTDMYNMLVGDKIKAMYPELFVKSEMKRQETMDVIDFATGVKVVAGTVGQNQRGNVQGFEEAARPDFLVFDDIETRDSLRSAVKTRAIWDRMQEAIDGLAKGGVTLYLANYISERGNVHRLVERVKYKLIIPIVDELGEPTWARFSKSDIETLQSKSDDFEGEYLCRPSASKDVLFDRESVDRQIAIQPIKTSAGAKIFKNFVASHRVAGGADVAGGLGLDSSASVFIDFDTVPAQVVLTYHNNEIRPSEFGHELARQANMYGECLIAPENNAFDAAIESLKNNYALHKIYAVEQKDGSQIFATAPRRLGWNTNSFTKSKMFNDLATAVENGWLQLNDEDLIREARSYTRNDVMDGDVDVRLVTRHFDLLTACAIALQMKDYATRPSQPRVISSIDKLFAKATAPHTKIDTSFE